MPLQVFGYFVRHYWPLAVERLEHDVRRHVREQTSPQRRLLFLLAIRRGQPFQGENTLIDVDVRGYILVFVLILALEVTVIDTVLGARDLVMVIVRYYVHPGQSVTSVMKQVWL